MKEGTKCSLPLLLGDTDWSDRSLEHSGLGGYPVYRMLMVVRLMNSTLSYSICARKLEIDLLNEAAWP